MHSFQEKVLGKIKTCIKELVLNDSHEIWKNPKLALNIETSIYNESIEIATKNDIELSWENNEFAQVYRKTFSKVYFNLFKNKCSVNVREKIKKGDLILLKIGDIVEDIIHYKGVEFWLIDFYNILSKVPVESVSLLDSSFSNEELQKQIEIENSKQNESTIQ